MSADDEAVTIGRMVVERKRLREQKTILDEAIRDYAVRVQSISLHLGHREPDETLLSNEELRVMESGTKINELLSERIEVRRRYNEVDGKLHLLGARKDAVVDSNRTRSILPFLSQPSKSCGSERPKPTMQRVFRLTWHRAASPRSVSSE